MKFPISRFTANGNSMSPALKPGQDVLSFNWAYLGKKPKVGDIVVIKVGDREMIKRVQSVHDPASPRLRGASRKVFVEGDNTDESTDSRHFGPIKMDQIVGKVIFATGKSHPELDSGSIINIDSRIRGNDKVDCPQCGSEVLGIYGRKDAICKNCGFKLTCCE